MNIGKCSVTIHCFKKKPPRDFTGGPVAKRLPCNAGDVGSIPGWEISIPHATEQLSPGATAREFMFNLYISPGMKMLTNSNHYSFFCI